MKKKGATIIDVAREVGVSPSTVSHALSGNRVISPAIKDKIQTVIRKLDYRPAFYAQALKNPATRLIGVVVNECRNAGTALFLDALADELHKFSYHPMISLSGRGHEMGEDVLRQLSTGLVDGVINLLPQISPEEAQKLCGAIPVVTNIRDTMAPVSLGFVKLMQKILDYLWSLGHRQIGYVSSSTRLEQEGEVVEAMKDFYHRKKQKLDEAMIFPGDDSSDSGYAGADLLYGQRKVTAIICGNDQMAFGVYQWAYKNGVSIPGQLSVVGFDNVPQSQSIIPPLTTAAFPYEAIISHTVKLLLAKIEKRALTTHEVHLDIPLILRDSVAAIE